MLLRVLVWSRCVLSVDVKREIERRIKRRRELLERERGRGTKNRYEKERKIQRLHQSTHQAHIETKRENTTKMQTTSFKHASYLIQCQREIPYLSEVDSS